MRWQGLLSLAALTALAACSSHQPPHAHYAVMPESALDKMMHQCSRSTPRATGAWSPGEDVIEQLESHLSQLGQQVTASGRPPTNAGEPNASFRQYQGIVVEGHQLIYINALPFNDPARPGTPSLDDAPMIVCDGGPAFWGAVYDPRTQTFSQWQGNGQCCGVDVPPPPRLDIPPPPRRPPDTMPARAATSGTR